MAAESNFLKTVKPDNYFILKNGIFIKSLPELFDVIKDMDNSVFCYHVNSSKDDFASWIGTSIGDTYLRNTLAGSKTQEQHLNIIRDRLKELNHGADAYINGIQTVKSGESSNFAESGIEFDIPAEGEFLNGFAEPVAALITPRDKNTFLNNNDQDVMAISADDKEDSGTEDLPVDLPPDVPPDADDANSNAPPTAPPDSASDEKAKQPAKQPAVDTPVTVPAEEPPADSTDNDKSAEQDIQQSNEPEIKKEQAQNNDSGGNSTRQPAGRKFDDETVEIREMEIAPLGLMDLDKIFSKGLPKICTLLFVGVMSSGKTMTALKLILNTAKKGERAAYLSFHDSEEKIINILRSMDKDILNYVNSGNILIKKLDAFEIANYCHSQKEESEKKSISLNSKDNFDCTSTIEFVEIFSPSLVVVDSLSALELSFSEDKQCYRHYVDNIFKYFEKLGIRAIFIKELVKEDDLHQEFFENILADCILHFSSTRNGKLNVKLIKDYPIPSISKPRGFLSIFQKQAKK